MRKIGITLILISFAIIFSLFCYIIFSKSKPLDSEENKKHIQIEVIEQALVDTTKMPSYCNPSSYRILHTTSGYTILLPGGTCTGDYFNTLEEAKDNVIKSANESKDRFIKSGGLDF